MMRQCSSVPKKRSTWGYSLLCLLVIIPIALAACGTANDGKIHLTLWYWNRSISDKLLAQVNTQFPNIVLNPVKVNDYDNKLRTSMAAHYGVPDIIAINDNITTFFPAEDQFYDLYELGAKEYEDQYLEWKWKLGVTPNNKMIGFPMDTGPIALFYRADIFEEAGLPTDPEAVSELIQNWDDYIEVGKIVKEKTGSNIVDSSFTIYEQMLAQITDRYFSTSGEYIGDQSHIREAWDKAAEAANLGITAKVDAWTPAWYQGAANGLFASFVGAVWMKQPVLEADPDGVGKWRVTKAPTASGNRGGSFLAVSASTPHPQEAFDVITWLQSPENQLAAFKELQLFPSAIETLNNPEMHQNEEFFGGQDTASVFIEAAKDIEPFNSNPQDGVVGTPMSDQIKLIERQNKNPDTAWTDAQERVQRELLR